MESNNELYKYDNCIHEPYLKCDEEGLCIICLRIENQIAKKWINYMNDYLVDNHTVLELPVEAT